jgi:hypothetical protein
MLGIVLFIAFFAIFAATLVSHRVAWVRESTFGAYRDGNKRQIVESAICYGGMSVALFVLYAITSNLSGMMQPELNLTMVALFLVLSGSMGFDAITRKPSAPAFAQAA